MLLFSIFYIKDKARQHGEGNDRNLLIYVYVDKTKGRKYKIDSIKGENGLKSSIIVAVTSINWQTISRENQASLTKFCIKSEVKKGVSRENYLEYCLVKLLFHF